MTIKVAIHSLDSKQIAELQQKLESRTYQSQTELIYKDHIPFAAFVLISGSVQLTTNKKIIVNIRPGQLFGLEEAISRIPFSYDAVISANSQVIALDKSTINEFKLLTVSALKDLVC